MTAACKAAKACVLIENYADPAEKAFAADTLTKEYHNELKSSLIDAYGDMRYEKLIPGKHVDH
eukprot:5466137-Pleurochrysis_carterae.AAC.1